MSCLSIKRFYFNRKLVKKERDRERWRNGKDLIEGGNMTLEPPPTVLAKEGENNQTRVDLGD